MSFIVLFFFSIVKGLNRTLYHLSSKSTTKAEIKGLGLVFVLWFLLIPDDRAQRCPGSVWNDMTSAHAMSLSRGSMPKSDGQCPT